MKKKIFLLIVGIILLTGCSNSNKFYLDKKYYNQGDFISATSKTIKDKALTLKEEIISEIKNGQ